jgi:hypothetical protein
LFAPGVDEVISRIHPVKELDGGGIEELVMDVGTIDFDTSETRDVYISYCRLRELTEDNTSLKD